MGVPDLVVPEMPIWGEKIMGVLDWELWVSPIWGEKKMGVLDCAVPTKSHWIPAFAGMTSGGIEMGVPDWGCQMSATSTN